MKIGKFLLNRSVKRPTLGQAIDQHLHKRKFPLMQAERPVAYINRCPDCLFPQIVQITIKLPVIAREITSR